MSLTYGFYDSFNKDRVYNTLQLSSIFDGIIADGVYANYGDHFLVSATTGMAVKVGTGRAWLNHTWTLNDTEYPLSIDTAEVVLERIDTVVLEVDRTTENRRNQLMVVKGTPASEPVAPELTKENDVYQYPLANIYVHPNATEVTAADIENRIGTEDLPWVTGIIDTLDATDLTTQWQAQVNELLEQLRHNIEQVASSTLLDGSVTTPKIAKKAVTKDRLADDAIRLVFTNTSVEAGVFVEDSTYTDYPYRASVALTNVTAGMTPEVIFGLADVTGGLFAPVAESFDGGIYLYAAAVPEGAISIPTIIAWQ